MDESRVCEKHGTEKIQRIRDGKRSGWYCRPCASERIKDYRTALPDKYLDTKLWTYYRIRLTDFQRMLAEQGGTCKICRKVPPPDAPGINGKNGFVVDHDHACCRIDLREEGGTGPRRACGKCIRGLLCQQCNIAIGMAQEDPKILQAMIDYLAAH